MKRATWFLAVLALVLALPASVTAEKGAPGALLSPVGVAGDTPDGVPDSQRVVDVSNTPSWDGIGDPDNVVVLVQMDPNAIVTGVGWDVILSAFGASWLSEPAVLMTDSVQTPGIFLTPGAGNNVPGAGVPFSSPVIDFSDNFLPNIVLGADGILRLEFFETFNDVADAIDGNWDSPSSLTFAGIGLGVASASVLAIPTLSVFGMVGLGLLMLVGGFFALRRRNA